MIGVGVASSAIVFSLLIASPENFLFGSGSMLASAVGARASVPENSYNTLAEQLAEKEKALNEREAAISQQGRVGETPQSPPWALMSFTLSLVLLVLVGINFYLDMRRRNPQPSSRLSVNLRRG